MITDIRTLPDGVELTADLGIIGGGAAAIAMAIRLSGARLKVAIFESGGLAPEAETTDLSAGETSGSPYFSLHETRIRMLGGSTYRWGARSAPMKKIDFERRDWVPMSGWPIGADDLAPYEIAVHDIIGLHRPFSYDGDALSMFKAKAPEIDRSAFDFVAFQFGKNLMFGEAYKSLLASAPNIDVYLHANVTGISLDPDGRRIESATIKTLNGKRFAVKARAFVLVCGGIENAKLLLNWNERFAGGLCNDSGLVGRNFMEHPTFAAGTVHAEHWQSLCDVFSPGLIGGRFVETGLAPSPAFQRDNRILNAVARIRPVVSADATQALREIIWNARHRKIPLNLGWYRNEWLKERLRTIAKDPLAIPLNVVRHLLGKPKRYKADSVNLELRTEQAPNPESRVTLTGDADRLGLRRAHVHWAMTPIDKRTMRVMAKAVDDELRRLGLGRVELRDWLDTDDVVWGPDMVGGHHHMGTTRMSENAADGVVDRNSKAHSLENLYIAGSSVFPTAGFVNPTYTILCLALRLADHLKARLAGV